MTATTTARVTFPNADIQSKQTSKGDTLTFAPRPMDDGHPTGYSMSFEFKVDDLNLGLLEILFGVQPKRLTTKLERAVALAVVIENALAAPARYGWALLGREVSLAASVPYLIRGVKR